MWLGDVKIYKNEEGVGDGRGLGGGGGGGGLLMKFLPVNSGWVSSLRCFELGWNANLFLLLAAPFCLAIAHSAISCMLLVESGTSYLEMVKFVFCRVRSFFPRRALVPLDALRFLSQISSKIETKVLNLFGSILFWPCSVFYAPSYELYVAIYYVTM